MARPSPSTLRLLASAAAGPGALKYTPTRHVCRLNTGGRTYVFALSSEEALMSWVGALLAVTQVRKGGREYIDNGGY